MVVCSEIVVIDIERPACILCDAGQSRVTSLIFIFFFSESKV